MDSSTTTLSCSRTRGTPTRRTFFDDSDSSPDVAVARGSSDDETFEDPSRPTTTDEEKSSDEDLDEGLFEKEPLGIKPDPGRVILEVDSLKDFLVGKNCSIKKCAKCGNPVDLKLRTMTITTWIEYSCLHPECDWTLSSQEPAKTTIHDELDDNYDRVSDYPLNILFVLALLFVGERSSEAGRLCRGFLGLPNDTTMEGRSFTIIEERIGPFIRELAAEILLENLIEEVKST